MSETNACRDLIINYCEGNGLDLGSGGAPIKPDCISIDLPEPYFIVGNAPINLSGDARNLFWFKDSVFDYVYSSHLLEDFPTEDLLSVLNEWLRVIKPRGYLVLNLPDEKKYRAHCNSRGEVGNLHHQNPNLSLRWFVAEIIPQLNVSLVYSTEIFYSFVMVLRKGV